MSDVRKSFISGYVSICVVTVWLALASFASFGGGDMRRPKKLIATGWDHPDSQRLLKNLEQMEERPFDGVIIQVIGEKDGGGQCRLRATFKDEKWEHEWFQSCVERLQRCEFERFTDNFITVGANPGNVDWFDDKGWQNIVEHWRIAASIAHDAGFTGLLFDPEPYTPPYSQFEYSAQPERNEHSFDEYYEKARERGRQVMRAVAEEYSDMTLYCYFMNSINARATGRADPRQVLKGSRYGLYSAFIDGWLDVVPPGVTMVDGCERAYRFNSEREYLEAFAQIKGACQELVSPENRATYRAQVQVSYGVYLDAYWNPKDSQWGNWYIDGKGGPRVERLRANVSTALRLADEYVWIYGEKFRWWPTPNSRVREKTWPEALPGCEKALRFARGPEAYARAVLKTEEAYNLARNGNFEEKGDGLPAGWSAWQEQSSDGTFSQAPQAGRQSKGAAKAAGVSNGCFLQKTDVKPGQLYAVRVWRQVRGDGTAWVRIRWQTPEGEWTATGHDEMLHCTTPSGEWGEMFGVAEVPEDVGKLVILLGAQGQQSSSDVIWYDDVGLYRLIKFTGADPGGQKK